MHTDFRNWLSKVETQGELLKIHGADCDLEMAGICELVADKTRSGQPVIMFDDIPGYSKDIRTLFGLFGSPWRVASTLGLPENATDRMTLLSNYSKKMRNVKPIGPVDVGTGPVCENIETGSDVDLLKFPTPKFHELDGGRYIGTCHGVIQRDPDTGFVNIGVYRVMLLDDKRVALHILEGQHGSLIMNQKYFAKGKPMPIAIAIGMDPTLWFSSFSTVPWGMSEYDHAGGIKGAPIPVFNGEYTGLPLPAGAEIILEGECRPGEMADEGPFGEWHGYYGNLGLKSVPEPVMEVKAVYYRNNPIMTCHLPGKPVTDSTGLPMALSKSNDLLQRLKSCGIPGVKGAWCHTEIAGDALFIVVSIEQLYPGHVAEVGLTASQYPNMGRYTIVVEEDIDPSDLSRVIWAMCTRGKPHEAIQVLKHCRSTSADTTISMEEKLRYKTTPKPLHNSRVLIDACRPLEWKPDWYPLSQLSSKIHAQIIEKFSDQLKTVITNNY